MIEWFHPALLMIVGGLLLPSFKGVWQKSLSLLIPLLVILEVSQLSTGVAGVIDFAGIELVLFKVDKLSLVFAWVFAIMAFIGNLYTCT